MEDTPMKQIELKSLAKINLGLDVLGRRENGYHQRDHGLQEKEWTTNPSAGTGNQTERMAGTENGRQKTQE